MCPCISLSLTLSLSLARSLAPYLLSVVIKKGAEKNDGETLEHAFIAACLGPFLHVMHSARRCIVLDKGACLMYPYSDAVAARQTGGGGGEKKSRQ